MIAEETSLAPMSDGAAGSVLPSARQAARALRPRTGAAPFAAEEIFFSRTDGRGVIASFNDVFLRIADYEAGDLIGAPHRIIRHPDMPKGVFHLLWEGIKAGHPIGAYVKNRARDGLHYWVFALVTPVEGGYLSVRIKPCADLLPGIEAEYARALAAEASGLSPEASAHAICDRLAGMGFPSYAAFQTEALLAEMQARQAATGRGQRGDLAALHRMGGEMRKLREGIVALRRLLLGANLLTANMRIVAAKLPEGRRTISEIARSYGIMLGEVEAHVAGFSAFDRGQGRHAACAEEGGLFLLCAAHLMAEVCAEFRQAETGLDGVDHAAEAAVLSRVAADYAARAGAAMEGVTDQARLMQRNVEFLRRLIVGLSTVRIACRVESGMLTHRSAGLETIVGRIDGLQDEIAAALDGIDGACGAALSALRDWRALRGVESVLDRAA